MIQEEWRITGIRISSKSNADVCYGDKIVRIPGEVCKDMITDAMTGAGWFLQNAGEAFRLTNR